MVVCLDKCQRGCHTNRNNVAHQCKRGGFHYFTLHTRWPVISIGNEFRAALKILVCQGCVRDARVDFFGEPFHIRCGGLGTKEKGNWQLKQPHSLTLFTP
jgi:hypothetical protein